MLSAIKTTIRPQLYSNLARPVYQTKYVFPITSQFHTAITRFEEEEFAHKGSVQYKLRGKVSIFIIA